MCAEVSIIVPAYNVEPYLEACIKSIVSGTYRNLEVLLVDDGSTDGTAALCDALAEKYPNVHVFHTPNQGLALARNHGMNHATGTYIGFVDSDDVIVPQMFELLVAKMESTIDMACCRYHYCKREDIKPLPCSGHSFNGSGEEIWNQILFNGYNVNVWSKLFRRDLIDAHNIRFKPGYLMEDAYFVADYLQVCRNAVFLNDQLYYYCATPNSIMDRLESGGSISEQYIAYPHGYIYMSEIAAQYKNTSSFLKAMAAMAYQRIMRRIVPLNNVLVKEAQDYLRENNHHLLRYSWGIKLFFSGLILIVSYPLWAALFRRRNLQ